MHCHLPERSNRILNKPFNIYITGVGGQGVVTLAHALRHMFESRKQPTTGAVLKGGAQRLGTVSASLRVFARGSDDYGDYSLEIPPGGLDLMIGLEPWECLRAARLFGRRTRVVVNRAAVPLLVTRTHSPDIGNPVTELEKLDVALQAADYAQIASERFGDRKMLNLVMGEAAVDTALPHFGAQCFNASFAAVTAHG